MTKKRFEENLVQDFLEYPHSYWAKKSDDQVHIPKGSDGTYCGKHAALLGNNYAPYLQNGSICQECMDTLYKIQNPPKYKLIILDFAVGEVFIHDFVPEESDCEDFLEKEGYKISNCQWMVTSELSIKFR